MEEEIKKKKMRLRIKLLEIEAHHSRIIRLVWIGMEKMGCDFNGRDDVFLVVYPLP